MTQISVHVLEMLRDDGDFALYRGRQEGKALPVLLLAPVAERVVPESLHRLEHEYSLAGQLDSSWAARPLELGQNNGRVMLVLDDFGGEPLDRLLTSGPPVLDPGLRIAIGLTVAVGRVHRAGLIHKDLKPANVLVDSADSVRLTGFGIASRLPREHPTTAPPPPEVIAGTLAYMAPEQTGRMNRSIDIRSDLYSLGVTLYELFTGVLPFEAKDPVEWVHCHIARQPISPGKRADIPEPLSAIIMKLLAKTPEERYQTASGLEADLRRCLAERESYGRVHPFPLGERDVSDRLMIPEKLYGREPEIAALLAAFDRVMAGGIPELVLVSGYPGIGKSSVVHELHKALVPPRGLFAAGKFDRFKGDIPYTTLVQAFQVLVRQILSQSEKEVNQWREALRDAMGLNGQLMINLMPELELIIGKQPPVPELPTPDAQNRFQMVFRRFLGVFHRPEHPLVLFLDDLQWLDAATLELMTQLMTDPTKRYLLLVGAYRDNEVDRSHPLMRMLTLIRASGVKVGEIVLKPLSLEDIAQLVADALHLETKQVQPLAQLVQEKTGGNPFFVNQFLISLSEEGLLAFDPATAAWNWDLRRISAKGYTDNIIDLMVGKLNRLPHATQEVLEHLACVGGITEIATLALVAQASVRDTHAMLWEAIRAGLVFHHDSSYAFIHDRVQEAAYSLIPEGDRAAVHLRIGRILLARMTPDEIADHLFDVVNQLNRGSELMSDQEEKDRTAELNLSAGRRAKASTAYTSASVYFSHGMAMLGNDGWARRYNLAFHLTLDRAECEFLSGNFELAEQLIEEILSRSTSKFDKAAAYRLQAAIREMNSDSVGSVASVLKCLSLFGIEVPMHPARAQVDDEYQKTWKNVGNRSIESLIDLPLMTDPEMLVVIDLLSRLPAPAFFTDVNLVHLHLSLMVNISVKYGTTGASTHGFALFGVFLAQYFPNFLDGFRFAKLAIDMVEKHNFFAYKARAYVACGLAYVWTQPISAALEIMRAAFPYAIESGDLVSACYSCNHVVVDRLLRGDPLDDVWEETEHTLDFTRKVKYRDVTAMIVTYQRFIQNMRGKTTHFSTFGDGEFDETSFEAELTTERMATMVCWYWIFKTQARLISGDYEAALASSEKAKALLWSTDAHIHLLEYHFYTALTIAALLRQRSFSETRRLEYLESLAAHFRQLDKWAQRHPPTFESRAILIAAEIAGLSGKTLEAEHLYEQAIRSAKENNFVHMEAIANELAANFYMTRGFETIAHTYLRNARYCYLRWGAQGKVKQLDQGYPRLQEEKTYTSAMTTIDAPVKQLDVATVTKASQALSSEIVLSELIEKLMRIVVEHVGADRGLLILLRGDESRIVAEATTSYGHIEVLLRHAAVTPVDLPLSALHYVIRTRESVILDDASGENMFSEDPYVRQRHSKSILCLPILKRAHLVGVLYLENNLTPRAFSSDYVAVLEILASQAAISLEHARLYADLQKENLDRKRAEEELRRSEAFLAEGQRISHTGSWGWNLVTEEIYWSEENYRILGLDPKTTEPSFDVFWTRVPPENRSFIHQYLDSVTREKKPFTLEYQIALANGEVKTLLTIGRPVINSSGEVEEYIGTTMDITERKQAEEALRKAHDELRQSQKMEAIGRLAGGVAHDFNNLLGIIIGYSQLLQDGLQNESEFKEQVEQISKAAEQAAALTRKLLTFSRRQMPQQKVLDLNVTLHELEKMVRSVVGENVELITDTDSTPSLILSDQGQIEQAILNLVINARDAMPTGGKLLLSARNIILDAEFASLYPKIKPGAYIELTVSDTGFGMDAATQTHIFEPFFTTKEQGKGTGLGLAIVYGTIEQAGGLILVESEPEQGTTFHIYIPKAEEAVPPAEHQVESNSKVGSETILLVEDQEGIRSLVTHILKREGYKVLAAGDGQEALSLARKHSGEIDLLITDVVMPQMSGYELAQELNRLRPTMKVLYISGYVDREVGEGISASETTFLEKPFSPDELKRQMRAVLDTPPNIRSRYA
jgi:PAS domain S-box-containing protein